MIVRIYRIEGNQRYIWIKEPAIAVCRLDPVSQLTPQDNQLMSNN
jgi:hypothetical protein